MAAAEALQPLGLNHRLLHDGFARLRPGEMAQALAVPGPALAGFAASWDGLETDSFMADGGRYRRRRHANFTALPGQAPRRGLHRPHFQASVHNSLNGGLDRWFAPMLDATVANPATAALLALGGRAADALHPGLGWFIEMHQFRIEAAAGAPGYPTPEGTHHDGVDLVLIAMIDRRNLTGGETLVTDNAGGELARFTLDGMLDATILDDARVMHGVTPIAPGDAAQPSRRDVLVVTWKALGAV
jgi:hypothetical protein